MDLFKKHFGYTFNDFYYEHRDYLLNYLYQYNFYNIDLESIADESFVRLYNHVKENKFNIEKASPKTFLFTIAINMCRKEIKSYNRLEIDFRDSISDKDIYTQYEYYEEKNVDEYYEEEYKKLIKFLIKLKDENKNYEELLEIILMRYVGIKIKEIAELFNMNESTLKSKIYYLKKLKRIKKM